MEHQSGGNLLEIVIILIAAAVFIVAIFRKLNLSPVLGYLVAGAFIGGNGFGIVSYYQVHILAELGVVFLLFAIGLELSIERLKAMRRYVFGLGMTQLFLTASIISGAVVLITQNFSSAIIIAGGLTLSSTAIVLQVLNESKSQQLQVGRISLSILILQDFAVVPLLVIIPLLANKNSDVSMSFVLGSAMLKAALALLVIFITGRLFLRPLFGFILPENSQGTELPIALTLLIVLATSVSTEYFGLSLALGAFAAGILVAETDFRHQAEESIYPFKSLLLGLFFMSVGMKIDVIEIYNNIYNIFILCTTLILTKTAIITILCLLFGFNRATSLHAGLLLSQGGEFAFILFELGKNNNLLEEDLANILLLVVTCSMALTPLLAKIGQKIVDVFEVKSGKSPEQILSLGASDLSNHMIVAGFGRSGKIAAKILESEGQNYIAIDTNYELVTKQKKKGFPIFRGDVSQIKTLKAVGAERAISILIAIENQITTKKACKLIKENFPNIQIVIRAKDLSNADNFYELGAHHIVPEVYESGVQMGSIALRMTGVNDLEVNRIKDRLRSSNYTTIQKNNSDLENNNDLEER